METRGDLEAQKLQAEIIKLWTEAQASERRAATDRRTAWTTIAISVAAVGSAFLTLGGDVIDLVQKRTDLYTVEIGQEMIDLAKQLSTGNDEERASAAILLSFYEEDAVPLLLTRLLNEPETTARPILESFRRIHQNAGRNTRDQAEESLLAYAGRVLDLDRYDPEGSIDPMLNFATALGELIDLRKEEAIELLHPLRTELAEKDCVDEPESDDTFEPDESQVQSASQATPRVARIDCFLLLGVIDAALAKLGRGDASTSSVPSMRSAENPGREGVVE